MDKKMVNKSLTEKEWDLIEAIRNYKKSMHNPSFELEWYVLQLFENLLYDNNMEIRVISHILKNCN
jgi:hypothetical protein